MTREEYLRKKYPPRVNDCMPNRPENRTLVVQMIDGDLRLVDPENERGNAE